MPDNHKAAIDIIKASGLEYEVQSELYDLYLEDFVESSEASAIEKLETGIRDAKEFE